MCPHDPRLVGDHEQQDQREWEYETVSRLRQQDDVVRRATQRDGAEHAGGEHESPEQTESAAPKVRRPPERPARRVGGGERGGDRRGQPGREEPEAEEDRRGATEERFQAFGDRGGVRRVRSLSEER